MSAISLLITVAEIFKYLAFISSNPTALFVFKFETISSTSPTVINGMEKYVSFGIFPLTQSRRGGGGS